MTADTVWPRARVVAAVVILAISVAVSFALYIETVTPPARLIDLVVHVIFFPLIYPIAPLFLDSAFGLTATAYATYPGIALALALIVGGRAPDGLAGAALLTVYLLPWTSEPEPFTGYQSGQLAASMLGLGDVGQILAIALPLLAIGALVAPRRPAGLYCLFAGAMAGAALLASATAGVGFGGLAVGGYMAIIALCVAAVVAIIGISERSRG